MTDDTELCKLIDDVNEIEKVEMKAARAENREPSAEVRAILDRWERDHPPPTTWRSGSMNRRIGSTTTIGVRAIWSDYRLTRGRIQPVHLARTP